MNILLEDPLILTGFRLFHLGSQESQHSKLILMITMVLCPYQSTKVHQVLIQKSLLMVLLFLLEVFLAESPYSFNDS